MNKKTTLYILLLPSLIGFLVFYIIPFIFSLPNIFFSNKNGFEGFSVIVELLNNEPFIRSIKNTFLFMAICLPFLIIIPLIFAILLKNMYGLKKIFLILFLVPMVIPSSSVVFFWKNMFAVNGFFNNFLYNFGVEPINWFQTDYDRIIFGVIFIWKYIGYNIVLFLGGLSSIPKEYYEYASMETNSKISVFKNITSIYILPTTIVVLLLSVINSFKIFREIYLISGSYPSKNSYMVQHFLNNQFNSLNYSKLITASTITTFLIGIIMIMIFYFEAKVTKNISE